MRVFFLIFLSLFLSVSSQSQTIKRYSKTELKEIIRTQQRKINDLSLKNEELAKLASKLDLIEKEKIKYSTNIFSLEKKFAEKEKDKDSLLNLVNIYKTEINQLRSILIMANKNSKYSSPSKVIEKNKSSSNSNIGTRKYITGPRGGCYYINGNGNKTYVDRSLCP